MSERKAIETQLWAVANDLRGNMDASEFRDYILGFIFYKYLSEKQHLKANEMLAADKLEFTDLKADKDDQYLTILRNQSISELGYYLAPTELFSAVVEKGAAREESQDTFILDDLKTIFTNIEQSTQGTKSEADFNALFEDMDLDSTKLGRRPDDRNKLITKVLLNLNKINFELDNPKSDLLGDAYEYLIAQFASNAGKKAGEFYTPAMVSKVLAKLVTLGKTELRNAYDPTCGSGSLLLRVKNEVSRLGRLYGQEQNRTTYNLARMNMLMHDLHFEGFSLENDDTLTNPHHLTMRFDAIVANPPFSQKWESADNPQYSADIRFSEYGVLAPKSYADMAFLQHMIYQLDSSGTLACVLPHGVLFRGGAEGTIRQYLIETKNQIDAIIGLPADLFYGTGIPTSILVLKKERDDADNILFIDASKSFERIGTQNVLRDEDVNKIIDTVKNRATIDKFSYLAPISEIAENDYNLNIPRYVDTFEEEEPVNLDAVATNLRTIDADIEALDREIATYLNELGVKSE